QKQAAASQRTEKERCEKHTTGMIPAEQCDGDTGKTILGREPLVVPVSISENFIDRNHSRQSTRNGHRKHDLLTNGNASVFGCMRIRAGGADFITPLCPPQEYVDDHACQHGENESKVQRNTGRKPGNDLPKAWNMAGD